MPPAPIPRIDCDFGALYPSVRTSWNLMPLPARPRPSPRRIESEARCCTCGAAMRLWSTSPKPEGAVLPLRCSCGGLRVVRQVWDETPEMAAVRAELEKI